MRVSPFAPFALAFSAGCSAPQPAALPPVRSGDMEVTATPDGAWTLSVAGRTLLRAPAGPLSARRYDETVRMRFGVWSFSQTGLRETRPRESATLTADGPAVVLRLSEGTTRASLRFERAADEVTLRARIESTAPFQAAGMRFVCEPTSHFLGFGEQYNAVDQRGRTLPLWVSEQGIGRDPDQQNAYSGDPTTTYFPVPFFLDPRGFGLAVDTNARVVADLCAARADEWSLAVEDPGEVLLHLYVGPTVPDVMRAWTVLQGRSAPAPAWSVEGVWLGVQGGPGPVRAAVAAARAADVPLGAIWSQDWLGRREFGGGNVGVRYRWSADESLYPDLAGLTRELHAGGVRFLGYFNPFLVPEQDLYETSVRENYIARDAAGQPANFLISVLMGGTVDLTNPRAVTWFQGYARTAVSLGIDGWMQDFGEWFPHDARPFDGSDPRKEHNRYPTRWHAAGREVLEADRPEWVQLTRSGWLREAAVAQVVWAGDQEATFSPWDGLPTVIPAMVTLGMSGIGFVTHDIAGFSGGPSTREVFQRWVELGAFSPVMRTHEGLQRAQNWSWNRDPDTLAHFGRFARIHRALAPAIMELGRDHQRTGMPIVRALSLQFPDDPRTYNLLDEYLLGDSLLVAPVVREGATQRAVYLPRGRWFDVWDPTRSFEGPREVTVEAPIGRPPVFSTTARTDLAAIR